MSGEDIPANFACEECRTKKFRCSKKRPSCDLCLQNGKECKYSPRVDRTPLTRKNLTAAEDRIRKLEAAFAELLPNVNINNALDTLSKGGPHAPTHSQSALAASPPVTTLPLKSSLPEGASPEAEETLPQQPDGFDWAEETTFNGLSDGMAALSIKPEGIGYLGATSSVMPLRALFTGDLGVEPSNQNHIPSNAHRSDMHDIDIQFTGPTAPLSGFSEHMFIDAYFLYYHTAYPFLHEATFRAQYSGEYKRPRDTTWGILLNTVLALGAWSIGDENSTMDDIFYHRVSCLSQDTSVFEVGNLALVQALLLLSNYTQKRNKPNTGWNYLGLAVRMALSLGLHKEFPGWKISLLQREMRRRVWWGIYIFDSGASITFGRPVLLPERGIMDANEVLNIHEEYLMPNATSLPDEISSPTVYSSLILQSTFHVVTNPLYHRLISNPPPSAHELLGLQTLIDDWQESIPSYFQPSHQDVPQNDYFILARYRLSWRMWNLRIISFRPVVLRWAAKHWATPDNHEANTENPDEEKCRLQCLQSARETIASISEYMANNIPSRLANWYILYFLFQAGLIPIIFLITTPTSPSAAAWLEDLRTTKDLLSCTAINNRLAGRCLEVMDRLCGISLEGTQPEAMLQDPELFNDVHSMFVGEQGDGMEFLDWSNFGARWEF